MTRECTCAGGGRGRESEGHEELEYCVSCVLVEALVKMLE